MIITLLMKASEDSCRCKFKIPILTHPATRTFLSQLPIHSLPIRIFDCFHDAPHTKPMAIFFYSAPEDHWCVDEIKAALTLDGLVSRVTWTNARIENELLYCSWFNLLNIHYVSLIKILDRGNHLHIFFL